MAEGIRKSFQHAIRDEIKRYMIFHKIPGDAKEIAKHIDYSLCHYSHESDKSFKKDQQSGAKQIVSTLRCLEEDALKIFILACQDVEEETHQAMEAAIHNFNSLHSRAGECSPETIVI